jgi:putative transposase
MMPRKARLDAYGTLHHVMARGIERSPIFRDNKDRIDFLEHLGSLAEETKTTIYAWALIPNHFHMLLRSGPSGLPHFMRRFLTGYAVRFNRKHKRSGHLFQNRYTSIVCEEDPYFMELIRYIHLNPIKANIVKTMEELDVYLWSGHSIIMGKKRLFWQDTDYVLQWFGHSKKSYRTFIQKGVETPVPDLEGGGLVRSSEGQISQKQRKNPVLADQRILGTGDFVNHLHTRKLKQKSLSLTERQQKMDEILQGHCQKAGIALKQLQGGSRAMPIPRIRSEIAHALTEELGIPYTEIARQLGVSHVAVLKMMKREGSR